MISDLNFQEIGGNSTITSIRKLGGILKDCSFSPRIL